MRRVDRRPVRLKARPIKEQMNFIGVNGYQAHWRRQDSIAMDANSVMMSTAGIESMA